MQQCDFCLRDQRVQLCILVTTTNTCMFLSNIDKDSEVTDSKFSIPVARLCLLRNLVILPHDLDTPTWMILKLLIFFVPIFFSFITNTCSRGESCVINIPYSSLKCKSEDWTWYRTECNGILSTRNRWFD